MINFSHSTVMLQGVLIVGERGTGKTSLALAIAAEAKVPVVKVEAQQLEAGLWVGQSASNVRELFQTARDLVVFLNLIIDFIFSFIYIYIYIYFLFISNVNSLIKRRGA
jgi:SpoVK/Ycf46/Vps4 family AAA+-type ATPase